jgi:hypothetical protein
MAIYLLREEAKYYFVDIAKLFGRHHAPIIYGHDTIAGLLKIGDKQTTREIAELTEMIKRKEGEIIEGEIGDNEIPELKKPTRKIWRHHQSNRRRKQQQ